MDDQLIFNYTEGNLSASEMHAVEGMLAADPLFKSEVLLWQKSRLSSPHHIAFPINKIIHKSWWQVLSSGQWLITGIGSFFLGALVYMVFPVKQENDTSPPLKEATAIPHKVEQIVPPEEPSNQAQVFAEVESQTDDDATQTTPTPNAPTPAFPPQSSEELSAFATENEQPQNVGLITVQELKIGTSMNYETKPAIQLIPMSPAPQKQNNKSKLKWGKPVIESDGF